MQCTKWMESMITMIQVTSVIWIAWLIPHLTANNSASVMVTLTAW